MAKMTVISARTGRAIEVEIPADPSQSVTLPEHRAAAIAAVHAAITMAEGVFVGGVSMGEQLSWTKKEAQARAWIADNNADATMLAAEAALTGETLADLAAAIITKANAYTVAAAAMAGVRRMAEAGIATAETAEQVDAARDAALAALAAIG